MRKRGIIGTLLLLMYLAGVGLFTGPSLAQLLVGHLPQPRLELIPFADMISVLTDKNAVGLGAFVNIAGNIALLFPLGCSCRCSGGGSSGQDAPSGGASAPRSALN